MHNKKFLLNDISKMKNMILRYCLGKRKKTLNHKEKKEEYFKINIDFEILGFVFILIILYIFLICFYSYINYFLGFLIYFFLLFL